MDVIPSTHPLTPPQSSEDRVAWVRLLRSRRVGVATFFRLMAEHGTAAKALEYLPEMAAEAGVKDYQVCPIAVAEQEIAWAEKCGAVMLTYGSPAYPVLLSDIPDPPPILWAMGDLTLLERSTVAVVGARNVSSLGTRMARRLAHDLGEAGHVVVSGLARGVDTAAHEAALKTGTIAVMAGGVDVIYPSENTVLAEEILRAGLRLSEAPMGLAPQARHFPRRNRIVSGLSRAVAVVEAAAKSGTLITADMALEQGREVFAVPGHPFDARSAGCNRLIRDGATLLRGANDILSVLEDMPMPDRAPVQEELALDAPAIDDTPPPAPIIPVDVPLPKPQALHLEIPAGPPETRTLSETAALHQLILDRLDARPMPEDHLIRDLARPAGEVAIELTALEMEGEIHRAPGGVLTRKH